MRNDRTLLVSLLLVICVVLAVIFLFRWSASVSPTHRTDATIQRAGPSWAYPDPGRTPGVTNPEITQEKISETICNPGWSTRNIRPPSSYTTKLKREQMAALGLGDQTSDYEEDHLIPLELAGDPTNPRNLWPQPYNVFPGAREKDVVERYLNKRVCDGDITLQEAQRRIAADWYRVYVEIHPAGQEGQYSHK
jgi:hypothetical protein